MTHRPSAVLTGDLVGSTSHPANTVEAAMQAIRAAAAGIAGWQPRPATRRFTRFRGDGWQILLAEPRLSLRAAVVVQGRLIALGLESRISIGIGPAESLGTADLSDATGEAFERSGRGLDQMQDSARLAIDGAPVLEEDRMIADLLGERMGRWTAAQAEAAGDAACHSRPHPDPAGHRQDPGHQPAGGERPRAGRGLSDHCLCPASVGSCEAQPGVERDTMTETFIALLFAHTLADFVLQTDWMVASKRNPLALGLHGLIVGVTAVAATGAVHPALLALALVHIGIDVGKLILTSQWKGSAGFGPFMIDQALHLVSLVALTLWLPDLWANGLWAPGAITTGEDGGILGTGLWSEDVAASGQPAARPHGPPDRPDPRDPRRRLCSRPSDGALCPASWQGRRLEKPARRGPRHRLS
jgi:hypothetical protein